MRGDFFSSFFFLLLSPEFHLPHVEVISCTLAKPLSVSCNHGVDIGFLSPFFKQTRGVIRRGG